MIMAKSNRFSGGYYRNAVETVGESEGSGSSGRIDTELTVSEYSSVPTKKCSSLNSIHRDTYGVPMQILPLSNISPFERKDLVHRLRSELEQIQLLLKKVELQRTNGVTLSSSSDILSCSNGHNKPEIENSRKQSIPGSVPGKKLNPTGQKPRGWNRGSSGKFESATQSCSPRTANALLMKQFETLLKRLMNHQYAWVFNTPVDVVKLNLPEYFTIIKHPMDLGTIKCKVASRAYSGPLEFVADVRLTFSNAMTYNPPGNDVHIMADALSKYFEVRWKAIEKKMPKINALPLQGKSGTRENVETARPRPPSKKSRIAPLPPCPEVMPPAKQVMTDEQKHNLGMELESLLGELPGHIVDFLKEHSSNGGECGEDEIEIDIDIDDLCDDTLFSLRKLLDDYLQEKQKNNANVKLCEIEGEKRDPEELRQEREKLEMERRKEKARLEAEAKAAEDAQKRAEAEARRKRGLEREAARQALLQFERTVEMNENSRFLEDLKMLSAGLAEQLPSSVDETSPDHSQDGLGSFKFGGSNPLEQLGLYMKVDDEEEEREPLSAPNPVNDVEEGEID